MKSLKEFLLGVLALVAVVAASAQTVPLPQQFAKPTVEQITGKSFEPPRRNVDTGEKDTQTTFYSAEIFARTYCRTEGVWYQGCATGSWDPTGTLVTYKVLWQEKVDKHKLKVQVEDEGDI